MPASPRKIELIISSLSAPIARRLRRIFLSLRAKRSMLRALSVAQP
jgi:hypothetical protein